MNIIIPTGFGSGRPQSQPNEVGSAWNKLHSLVYRIAVYSMMGLRDRNLEKRSRYLPRDFHKNHTDISSTWLHSLYLALLVYWIIFDLW